MLTASKNPQLEHEAASQSEQFIKNPWETNSVGFFHKELNTSEEM